MEKNLVTSISWESLSYVWEVKDFLELREMAENEFSESSSRIESSLFGSEEHGVYFILWLFPYGQKQHSSVGSIDLSLMCKKIQNSNLKDFVIAKWSAYFLDEDDNQIVRTKLKDPLKKYSNGGDGRRFSYSPTDTSIHKWIVHNSLKIKCNVHIALNVLNEISPCISKQQNVSLMLTDVSEYCKRDDSKDVTIICQNLVYHASKFMLCARSEVLRRMLNGNFKEGKKREIHLLDISSKAAKNMLDFIHVDSCQILEVCKNKNKNERDANDLLDLFAVADRYDIKALYSTCLDVLVQRFDEKTFVDLMTFAEQVNCKRLSDAGKNFLLQTNGWVIWEKLRNYSNNNSKCNSNDSFSVLSSSTSSSSSTCLITSSFSSFSSSIFSSSCAFSSPFVSSFHSSSSLAHFSCNNSTATTSSCASAKFLASTVRTDSSMTNTTVKTTLENSNDIKTVTTSTPMNFSSSTFRLVSYSKDKSNNVFNLNSNKHLMNSYNGTNNFFSTGNNSYSNNNAANSNNISSFQFALFNRNLTPLLTATSADASFSSCVVSSSSVFPSSIPVYFNDSSSFNNITTTIFNNNANNIMHSNASLVSANANLLSNTSSYPSSINCQIFAHNPYSYCAEYPMNFRTNVTAFENNNNNNNNTSNKNINGSFTEVRRGERRDTFCENLKSNIDNATEAELYEGSTDNSSIFKEEEELIQDEEEKAESILVDIEN